MRWEERIARTAEMRNEFKILVGKSGGKISLRVDAMIILKCISRRNNPEDHNPDLHAARVGGGGVEVCTKSLESYQVEKALLRKEKRTSFNLKESE